MSPFGPDDRCHAKRPGTKSRSAPGQSANVSTFHGSKPAGIEVLYRRIDRAAHKVCTPLASRGVSRMFLWRDCREQAVANAVASINRPMLTALYRSRTARSASG